LRARTIQTVKASAVIVADQALAGHGGVVVKSKAVLQIFLIVATLFGIAGYAFVHGPYAEPMTGS
jgi:hypothetical protein